jgi:uncharacterized protein YaiL (DUF2058 family)
MDKILNASYGDKQQRDANRKAVDPRVAARVEAEFKARKAAQGPREVREMQSKRQHTSMQNWQAAAVSCCIDMSHIRSCPHPLGAAHAGSFLSGTPSSMVSN